MIDSLLAWLLRLIGAPEKVAEKAGGAFKRHLSPIIIPYLVALGVSPELVNAALNSSVALITQVVLVAFSIGFSLKDKADR